jgi:signal transduction histidine kinase
LPATRSEREPPPGWPPAALARIAELEQQLAQLREANGRKDEFISMVAHELRGPLTAVKGAARTLLRHRGRLDPEVARQLLENVDSESDRLDHILDGLLALSRAEAGLPEPGERSTPLRPLLAKLVAEMRPRAGTRQLTLRASPGLPPARAHSLGLEQIVRNLLDNALKYSPPEARVVVTATRRGDDLEVAVRNDGPPIRPDVLARLFDRFYRGPSFAGRRGGSGLGLTICRRLVEAQGGRIWAESDRARGTVVRFTVPPATETVP